MSDDQPRNKISMYDSRILLLLVPASLVGSPVESKCAVDGVHAVCENLCSESTKAEYMTITGATVDWGCIQGHLNLKVKSQKFQNKSKVT